MLSQSDYHPNSVPLQSRRSCGDCRACCTVMAVSCLAKPAGTSCVHLHKSASDSPSSVVGGCSIYASRPEPCAGFVCVWLRDTIGLLEEKDRPDHSGIIFTASNPDSAGQQSLEAREVYPGASQTSGAQQLLSRLRSLIPLCIVPFKGDELSERNSVVPRPAA